MSKDQQLAIESDLTRDPTVLRFSKTLENVFDFSFQIVSERDAEGFLLDYGVEQIELPRNQSVAIPFHAQQRILMIPFPNRQREVQYAVTLVQTHEPELYCRLADCCIEVDRLNCEKDNLTTENSDFVQQVSNDFEELHFLREVAKHLEINRENVEFHFLAEQTIQLLSLSVRAGALVVVLETDPLEEPDIISMYGSQQFSDEAIFALLKILNPDPEQLPNVSVQNFSSPNPGIIHSYVAAPIRQKDELMGWLLALNRTRGTSGRFCEETSECEFGSGEATLLESAATLLATHMVNLNLLQEKQNLLTNVVRSLVSAIDAKDGYTCGHSERVALYARKLAEFSGYEEKQLEQIYLSGLLHDVGKIGISDTVLNKPAPLDEEELEQVMQHPDEGWKILSEITQLANILPGVLHHHERIDGKGYPDGLAGEQIPLDGRILAVVDAFDAMTSDRAYRDGMAVERAVEILKDGSGVQWDALLIQRFVENLDAFVQIKNNYQPTSQQKPVRKRT